MFTVNVDCSTPPLFIFEMRTGVRKKCLPLRSVYDMIICRTNVLFAWDDLLLGKGID